MKGFFDKNIKSRSKDDRFEAALSFSPFDAFLSLKALDNFLPHCLVGCGSARFGGEQELAFTWFYRAVKSYNVIRRCKFIWSKVSSARISATYFENESMGAQKFDQKAF